VSREAFQIEIVNKRRNPLIGRLELDIVVHHVGGGTPQRYEIRKTMAKQFKAPLNCVYVKRLVTEYGVGRTVGHVHIYDSEERAKAFEPEYLVIRNLPPEEREKLKSEE